MSCLVRPFQEAFRPLLEAFCTDFSLLFFPKGWSLTFCTGKIGFKMIGATRLVHLIWNTLPKIHFVQLTSNRQSPFCTEIASGGWANHFVHIQIIPNRHGEPHFVQVFFQHPVGVQNGTPSDFCVPFCGL